MKFAWFSAYWNANAIQWKTELASYTTHCDVHNTQFVLATSIWDPEAIQLASEMDLSLSGSQVIKTSYFYLKEVKIAANLVTLLHLFGSSDQPGNAIQAGPFYTVPHPVDNKKKPTSFPFFISELMAQFLSCGAFERTTCFSGCGSTEQD